MCLFLMCLYIIEESTSNSPCWLFLDLTPFLFLCGAYRGDSRGGGRVDVVPGWVTLQVWAPRSSRWTSRACQNWWIPSRLPRPRSPTPVPRPWRCWRKRYRDGEKEWKHKGEKDEETWASPPWSKVGLQDQIKVTWVLSKFQHCKLELYWYVYTSFLT